MEARIVIADTSFEKMIKSKIDETFEKVDLESLIEKKLNSKVDAIITKNLSPGKVESFVRDRVSRIITTESLKEYTGHIQAGDVLANVESKILLMIKNSSEFKGLVKSTLKSCL